MNWQEEYKFKSDVEEIIKSDIYPLIKEHGGNISIESIENGIITITLLGNCKGCPSAQITTEQIVKECLVEKLGNKVVDVRLHSQVSDEMWDYAKKILKNEV